jgi:anti-sigma B factor antagonist
MTRTTASRVEDAWRVGNRRNAVEILERRHGTVVVLDLKGRLIADDDNGHVKDKINSLVLQGHRLILLNLAGTTYIDSIGLGQLVAAHATITRRGGRIVLVSLTRRVHDLLAICRLATVFDTFDTEVDALRSLLATTEA